MELIVTADLLNIRTNPDTNSDILGKVKKGEKLEYLGFVGEWFKVKFEDREAYVMAKFVDVGYLCKFDDILSVKLIPNTLISEDGNKFQRLSKNVYNKYGNFLEVLSDLLGIDLATAIAIVCVESGGNGIENGRVLIRFENHLFYRNWGKNNKDVYDKHFQFNPNKNWLEHKFRINEGSDWINFHGNQDNEYKVFNYAYNLDKLAALNSISIGLPQILCSNHKMIGYDDPQVMFDNFNKDIRFHIIGLFDFLKNSENMMNEIKNNDFVTFAKYYNGGGQAENYGNMIKSFHDWTLTYLK